MSTCHNLIWKELSDFFVKQTYVWMYLVNKVHGVN